MKIELTKQGYLLIAESIEARTTLEKIKNGNYVMADIKVPRSIRQHRFYWGMLSLVFENQLEPACFGKVDHLHNAIKMALGYTTELYDLNGVVVSVIPDKTDFASMDRLDFQEFKEKAIKLFAEKIIPNMQSVDLERRFYEMLGERNL